MLPSAISKHVDFRLVPPGVTLIEGGAYFSAWSPDAKDVIVHLYDKSEREIKTVSLSEKKGACWYGFIEGVQAGDLYAYETVGDYDPSQGHFFMKDHVLVDPFAKAISKPFVYTPDRYENHYNDFIPKSIVVDDSSFDWEGIGKTIMSVSDLIVYECNVKGMTMLNPDVPPQHRGKFLGLCHPKVINHLKRLGVTAVQLNPIYAFITEPHLVKHGLVNYWGYNPVCYNAPDPRYAVDPRNAVFEFKTMVKEFHRNGIAVILDVVYNHTGEGGAGGSVLSLKGFDAKNYYVHPRREDGTYDYGQYYDVTGCGNSVNVDTKAALKLVTTSMEHWLDDMQVDGFRFDLGVALCRETHCTCFHEYDRNSGFLKECFVNETISKSILIAEPWDIGPNGYRVGQFPEGWSEQNDKFRDTVRRFWRGDKGIMGEYVTRVMGSRDIYTKDRRSIKSSVNFVTYHDGFTLEDLVTYSHKYNEANCEGNRDGSDHNYSCNCGIEGPTTNKTVIARRWQLKRNLIATTLLGQGVPHILGGDEFSRTQGGNNNAYCQDNEISWLKWDYSEENKNFIDFISMLTQIRRESLIRELLLEDDYSHRSIKKTVYQGKWYKADATEVSPDDWKDPNLVALAFLAEPAAGSADEDIESLLVVFSQSDEKFGFKLPPLSDREWVEIFDTSTPTGMSALKKNSNLKHTMFTCPCFKIFVARVKAATKIVESTSFESLTRHINRS